MPPKSLTDKEIVKLCEDAVENFSGNSHELERAIGSLFVGRKMGWKVLYLIHDQKTVRKYEEILNLSFKDVLPDKTERSKKSIAYNAVRKM
ncbi:MAG: hypothetical protein IPM20_12665 [Gammaproteobacteria bacterium]|nr:hypothetical protein [Gammaproteobacteria bacterium]